MTLKKYISTMLAVVSVSWISWIFVINIIDPYLTNWIGIALFYGSLFLALLGTASLLGFIVRFVALRQKLAFRVVNDAFRQSFFFSFFLLAILFLLSKGLFSWLNLVFLISGLSVLEFFLISVRK
ncbi:MAG: hypothetical protein PF572_05075 [Patescibacteria group bacterium]|jgi:hypothetical protein|nr:hypothetical protein [Patescibacteria group bacterium]